MAKEYYNILFNCGSKIYSELRIGSYMSSTYGSITHLDFERQEDSKEVVPHDKTISSDPNQIHVNGKIIFRNWLAMALNYAGSDKDNPIYYHLPKNLLDQVIPEGQSMTGYGVSVYLDKCGLRVFCNPLLPEDEWLITTIKINSTVTIMEKDKEGKWKPKNIKVSKWKDPDFKPAVKENIIIEQHRHWADFWQH